MSTASSIALRTKRDETRVRVQQLRQRADVLRANMESQAVADALDEPFDGERVAASDLAEIQAQIKGAEAAITRLSAQIPAAEAAEEQVQVDQRVAQGRHVATHVIPPLLTAAKEAGQAFADALSKLAAAEDKLSNRLQRRLPLTHVNGNASTLLMSMVQSRATNVFFEAGPGRGPWDIPAYAVASAQLDDQLQEIVS